MPRSKFDFEDAAEAAPEEQDARWGGHYDALGISHGASVDDVRTAYSLRVLQAHPDKGGQLRVEDQAEGERQACQDAAARSSQQPEAAIISLPALGMEDSQDFSWGALHAQKWLATPQVWL